MNPHHDRSTGETAAFRYGVYTRKSSEYEDSQIQSIQRQIDDLSELIDREGLAIHREVLTESQSAFHPGREEFAKLVEWTRRGHINAWLCWHANRLSRNPVDAGTVVYLMDQGKLHHIRTRERVYYNTPTDKFMLQMEFTMSKKDSDDKSALVRSGVLRRHRRGYPSSFPPPGYMLRGSGRSRSPSVRGPPLPTCALRGLLPRVKEVGADAEFLGEFCDGATGFKQFDGLGLELCGVAPAGLRIHGFGFWRLVVQKSSSPQERLGRCLFSSCFPPLHFALTSGLPSA